MSNCSTRLSRLFEELGLKTDEGFVKAEIAAYCAGIDMVENYITNNTRLMFPHNVYENYSKYTPSMGDLIVSNNSSSTVLFGYRMKGLWGELSQTEFDKACMTTCHLMEYQLSEGEILFAGYIGNNPKKLGDVIKGYVPVNLHSRLDTNGSSFNEWGSRAFMWCTLDEWEMPFDILDDLEVLSIK